MQTMNFSGLNIAVKADIITHAISAIFLLVKQIYLFIVVYER